MGRGGHSISSARRGIILLACLFPLLAALALVWPAYRSFLSVKINENEGWNAYYADAAFGQMPLYPSLDKLITNNYPPISYYIVGACGHLIHDNVLAGRFLSLAAVVLIGLLIALIIRELDGSSLAALVGGSWFVATMCLFLDRYVGMNEPELMTLAVMSFGFLLFLRAERRGLSFWPPLAVMVIAGFFKHNTVVLPFSALLWLLLQGRWAAFFSCLWRAALLIAIGFLLCFLLYGRDFFANLCTPRVFSLDGEPDALWELTAGAVVLAAWLIAGWLTRRQKRSQLISTLIITGVIVHLLERTGEGVDINSQMDLLIALAIAIGVVFSLLEQRRQSRGIQLLQCALLLLLIGRFACSDCALDFLKPFTPAFREEIALHEKTMHDTVAKLRATPGDVRCDALASYWAGKRFVIDEFNLGERIATGRLPADIADRQKAAHALTEVEADPDIAW